MELSFDILDCIFGFLVSDRKTLIACSRDPVLSPFVERHVYYNIIVQLGLEHRVKPTNDTDGAFEPHRLSKFVSENPRVLHYVRILQIQIGFRNLSQMDSFANTLLMFPVLERIVLTSIFYDWRLSRLPGFLRAALEDRFGLPTVKEVHLIGDESPVSLLKNSKHIKNLSLSAFSIEGGLGASTLPQLYSLRLLSPYVSYPLLSWLKLYTNKLRSLKSALSDSEELSQLLGLCSGTLNKLDFELGYTRLVDVHHFRNRWPELFPALPSLEELTIRVIEDKIEPLNSQYYHMSWLPAVPDVVNFFLSSLRRLSIDINIRRSTASDVALVDFSPLAGLGDAFRLLPRIDIYIYTRALATSVTRAQVLSSLEVYENIAESIKDGTLVIHAEETAPGVV